MGNFVQFCVNVTNPNLPDVDTDEVGYYPEYSGIIDSVTNDIKRRLEFIDRVSIPYIEGAFENIDNVGKKLESTNNEDIPDAMLNLLSNKVYDCGFNSLSNDKRSIIAVLGVYILIY